MKPESGVESLQMNRVVLGKSLWSPLADLDDQLSTLSSDILRDAGGISLEPLCGFLSEILFDSLHMSLLNSLKEYNEQNKTW